MRLVLLAATVVVGGCGSKVEPRLDAIEPAMVSTLVATPAVVHGEALYAAAHVDLDKTDPAQLDRVWHLRAGGTDLGDVSWIDPQDLGVVVPSGLVPGVYDVDATDPAGLELALPAALSVTAEPFGLALAIEDAPGGRGHTIGGTLAAGDHIAAYAVVREPSGAYVADVAVDWATTSAFGTLDAGPAAMTMLVATTVGGGRLTATRAAASLTAESGELAVIAGAPAALVIVDAPGAAGQPIGNRTGLTTDPTGGLVAFAVARDAFGNFAGDIAATWSLSGVTGSLPGGAATTAAIDFATPGIGVLHAIASVGGAATGNLEVAAGHAAQLVIAPATLTISADAAPIAFTATATDGDGNATTDLGTLTWSISAGAISAITSGGVLDPQHAGTGAVAVTSSYGATATSGAVTIQPGAATVLALVPSSLTISADAAPVVFAATGTDADGNATTNLGTLVWSIASGPITSVGSATGAFDPQHAGSGTVAVTSSLGATQTAPVTVTAGRAATLAISPGTADVVAGGTPVAFATTGVDADGNPTADRGALTWSRTGTFGALDAGGVLTPLTAGSGSVQATSTYGVVAGSGTVRVRRAATLGSTLAVTSPLALGTTATVTLTLTNTGESDAANVVPCALTSFGGGGAVQVTAGPLPASAAIAAGTAAQFTWTITGQTAGSLTLSSCGSGVDATTGVVVTSPNAVASVTVSPPASLVASIAVPASVGRGEPFAVTMLVTNTGSGPATGVTPSSLIKTGTATVALVSSPSGGVSIAAGGNATFTWTYSASTLGTVQLGGSASGTDLTSGLAISSPNAQSNLGSVVESLVVEVDPFGDGSRFGFVCGYHGEVVVGPNATGTHAVEFQPDGTNEQSLAFTLPADVTGHKSQNTSSPPFPSIGATGCTPNTATCGPDNEDGRGTFATVTIAGTEWIVAAGARAAGNNTHYIYMTTDTDPVLDFSYVDLSVELADHALAFSAVTAVNDILYLGAAGNDGKRPRLVAVHTMPSAPGLDADVTDVVDLNPATMPGIQGTSPDMIDSMIGFASRLYFANDGVWARATVPVPRPYPTNPADWSVITPTSSPYTQKTDRTTSKDSDFEPADRAIPQMAAFGGRLFAGRNTTAGPQLWSCDPTRTGDPLQCDSADWSLIAPNSSSCFLFFCNGDTKLTQFDDGSLTSISMVVATASYLYVGFDSSNGAIVFRTANPAATTQSDFEGAGGCSAAQHDFGCDGYGRSGFGSSAVTRIWDAKALTFGSSTSVWITAGSSTTPFTLVELP